MNLQDFIQETLVQVCSATTEAQKQLKNDGSDLTIGDQTNWVNISTKIDFDIAVTAHSEENNEKASGIKGGLRVLEAFSLVGNRTKKESEKETNTEVSRVKFSIPITIKQH